MKDKKAFLFYFLMTLILLDLGNQLKILSYNKYFHNINNPIFSITHLQNSGSAFSLFQNSAYILAFLGGVVVLYITYHVWKNVLFSQKFTLLSLTLFCAGVLGNMIERIRFAHVIDYIKLNNINFPVFNAFDIMICVGIFLYILFVLPDWQKVLNEKKDSLENR